MIWATAPGAIASVNKALELSPDFAPALEMMNKLGAKQEEAPKPPPATASRDMPANRDITACVFPVSGGILERKTIDQIIAACTALIETPGGSDGARAQIYLQRGSMYRRLAKYDLALADFSQSIRYDPKSAAGYTGRGNALSRPAPVRQGHRRP